ncbi:MAG TPA: branched-chain amino acid ABC transporter permease [Cellulomonas sp.]
MTTTDMSQEQDHRPAAPSSAVLEQLAASRRRQRRLTLIGAGVALVLLAVLPFVLTSYWLFLASSWLAYTIAVMGARVLFGVSGVLSLAQATFVGIGGYAAALGSTELGLTAIYELALVLVVAVAASLLVGLPALRVGGLRLALLTLAFGELFQWWVLQQRDLTGGPQGKPVASLWLAGVPTTDPLFLYGMCALAAVLVTVVLGRLPRLQLGRNMAAVKESEFAARSVGVNVTRTKLTAFVVAGVCAGIAGFLLAHVEQSVSPQSYDLFDSVYILVGVILGGSGSTLGAWLGAAYVSLAPPVFASFGQDRLFVLLSGAILVVLVYLLPGGLVEAGERLPVVRSLRRWLRPRWTDAPGLPVRPAATR